MTVVKKRQKYFLSLIFLSAAILIIIFTRHKIDRNTQSGDKSSVLVETQQIQRKTIVQTLPVYGTIDQSNNGLKTISFPYAVRMREIFVSTGNAVQKGQPLFSVDTDPAVLAAYHQAKADLESTQTEYQRQQRLLSLALATKSQAASAHTAFINAKANFEIQKQQGNGINKQSVSAPFDAVITEVPVKPGDRVSADLPVLRLADRYAVVANLGVDPAESGLLKPNMPAQLISVLDKKQILTGSVKSIGAMINPTTRFVDVRVQIDKNSPAKILAGTPVQGKITISVSHCLSVSQSTLLNDEQGDYLYQISDKHAHRINIFKGAQQNNWVCISGKLDPAKKVVTSGNYELNDGMAVREK
jgi:RND family efflux transporter MFP subunit